LIFSLLNMAVTIITSLQKKNDFFSNSKILCPGKHSSWMVIEKKGNALDRGLLLIENDLLLQSILH